MRAKTFLYIMQNFENKLKTSHSASDAIHTQNLEALKNLNPEIDNIKQAAILTDTGAAAYGECVAYKKIRHEVEQIIYVLEDEVYGSDG